MRVTLVLDNIVPVNRNRAFLKPLLIGAMITVRNCAATALDHPLITIVS